jgi:hypothetical protein
VLYVFRDPEQAVYREDVVANELPQQRCLSSGWPRATPKGWRRPGCCARKRAPKLVPASLHRDAMIVHRAASVLLTVYLHPMGRYDSQMGRVLHAI